MTRAYVNRFLMTALLAHLALGTSLGCSLVTDSDGAERQKASVGGGDSDCVTLEGPDGEPCVSCTDPGGVETTMCAPADCSIRTRPDGAICTTCADVEDNEKTVCADELPQDCVSEMRSIGFVCTTCNIDGQPVTTCSSAHCHVSNFCLECRDPRGNTATDCSKDYESMPTGSSGMGEGGTWNSCTSSSGYPDVAMTSCHYPGYDTCTITGEGDSRCMECTYPDGSGRSSCPYDGDPDIFAGRPPNLPEPGACVDKTSPNGRMVCTTCTRSDLSATTTCRHPAAIWCDVVTNADHLVCAECTLLDGSTQTYCEPASPSRGS